MDACKVAWEAGSWLGLLQQGEGMAKAVFSPAGGASSVALLLKSPPYQRQLQLWLSAWKSSYSIQHTPEKNAFSNQEQPKGSDLQAVHPGKCYRSQRTLTSLPFCLGHHILAPLWLLYLGLYRPTAHLCSDPRWSRIAQPNLNLSP